VTSLGCRREIKERVAQRFLDFVNELVGKKKMCTVGFPVHKGYGRLGIKVGPHHCRHETFLKFFRRDLVCQWNVPVSPQRNCGAIAAIKGRQLIPSYVAERITVLFPKKGK
jgi:hypothetical protein